MTDVYAVWEGPGGYDGRDLRGLFVREEDADACAGSLRAQGRSYVDVQPEELKGPQDTEEEES
jgi:hypothetical protein